jgi:hypothetical protein
MFLALQISGAMPTSLLMISTELVGSFVRTSKEGLLLALVLWVELMLTGSVQRRAAMNHGERSSPGSVRYPRGLFKKT